MPTEIASKSASANDLLLRRKRKVKLAPGSGGTSNMEFLHGDYVATVAKNLESIGYAMSVPLLEAVGDLSQNELIKLNSEMLTVLGKSRGADRQFNPLYPNFPQQVMQMSEASLYLNALVHYLTDGLFKPGTKKKERPRLIDNPDLQLIELGTEADIESIFTALAGSNASLSEQDKEDLSWFVSHYQNDIERLFPERVPQRENKAFIGALLLVHTQLKDKVKSMCSTTTDVLRLAVAMSEGDVSLAAPTKFKSFKRFERRALLETLEAQNNIIEDMLRWKKRWIRLGERLHPGEFRKQFPKSAEAFYALRKDIPVATFNNKLESAFKKRDLDEIITLLKGRPGEFARKLDFILRIAGDRQEEIGLLFAPIAEKVSTPVLLQVLQHFNSRNDERTLRVFFPKGNLAKAQGKLNNLPEMPKKTCDLIGSICRSTLKKRFQKLAPLGRCYLDVDLKNFLLPFSQRSASKSLRTVARGSKLFLPDADTLRFFIWWKNGKHRTDIDLSAAMFTKDFEFRDCLTYYNLKGFGGHHSGDIVDAPLGASEFIDVSRKKCLEHSVAYIVMVVNSFTQQPYCDLPECFAGWMSRKGPNSGEIYEPKTVEDKLDLSANTRISIPVIFDLRKQEAIWTDIALTKNPGWSNNVENNLRGLQLSLRSFIDLNKMSLYDLLEMHIECRGEQVKSEEGADVVFSVKNGTQFELDLIASQYMKD